MQINHNVHQIRIDFQITENIKRYVYVYLITGKYCYLIDSGVAGSEKQIANYMKTINRDIKEIKVIFITHAHPDHIGGAAMIQKLSKCQIYASYIEQSWIEDIHTQFSQRPIPNFFGLLNKSVHIDKYIDNQILELESDITLEVLETPGHSYGSISFVYIQEKIVFCGDAIPMIDDFPIIVDVNQSQLTLEKIKCLDGVRFCCPAWDKVYKGDEVIDVIEQAQLFLQQFYQYVNECEDVLNEMEDIISYVSKKMKWNDFSKNPLFYVSVQACIQSKSDT